jgi:hypothetical protein
MKAYRAVDVQCYIFVGFTPRPLYPRGNSPQYLSDRRLGGLIADLEAVEERDEGFREL